MPTVIRSSSEALLEPEKLYSMSSVTLNRNLGTFYICGAGHQSKKPHRIVLQQIKDDKHVLGLHVNSGETGSGLLMDNTSSVVESKAEFSLAHAGLNKKHFKPGEILIASEVYTFTWKAVDLENNPVIVSLYVIPLPIQHGLKLLYRLAPDLTVKASV